MTRFRCIYLEFLQKKITKVQFLGENLSSRSRNDDIAGEGVGGNLEDENGPVFGVQQKHRQHVHAISVRPTHRLSRITVTIHFFLFVKNI